MGARGPAPKPDALKVLQGNPGKRPLNNDQPKYDIELEVPKPPTYLSSLAKKEWKRVVPMLHRLKVLTKADIASLAAYCQSFSTWIEAEKKINSYLKEHNKLYYTSPKGERKPIPEIDIANQAMKNMRDFAREFGMTPSSRSSIKVEEANKGENPFAVFIRNKKNEQATG